MASLGKEFDVFSSVAAPVLVLESSSREIKYLNGAFEEVAGVDASSVVGSRISSVDGLEIGKELESALDELEEVEPAESVTWEGGEKKAVSFELRYFDDRHLVITVREASMESEFGLSDTVIDLCSAESEYDIEETLVESVEGMVSDIEIYRYDGGVLKSRDGESISQDSIEWRAFSSLEPRVIELPELDGTVSESYYLPDLTEEEASESDSGTPHLDWLGGNVRLAVPLGRKKVVSAEVENPSREEVENLVTLVKAASLSMKRVVCNQELERMQRRNSEVERQREQLFQLLDVLTKVIGDVRAIDGKEDVRHTLCERLLEVDCWDFVWIVEKRETVQPKCTCERLEVDRAFVERLSSSYDNGTPTAACLREGETYVVNDVAAETRSSWRLAVLNAGYRSAAAVPLRYENRKFGALEVYSEEPNCFDETSVPVLEEIAGLLGYALVSAEQATSLLSGDYQRISLKIDARELNCYFAYLVREVGEEANLTSIFPESDRTKVYFEIETDRDEVYAASESIGVSVEESGKGYIAEVSGISLVEEAMEVGGRVSSYDYRDGEIHIDINLPRGVEASELLDVVRNRYPEVELAAKKHTFDEFISEGVLEDLTERQEDVLRLAYQEGFFESPRENTGDDIAGELGITATTFHQHLRSAEKALVSNLFDGEPEG